MIVLPPYMRDYNAYHLIPEEDRWIFNKMEICKRFGYEPYGPCGSRMSAGTYCIRPIINLGGMAKGGFWKEIVKEDKIIWKPGYCWTPWETGARSWVEYIDGKVSSALKQISWDENTQLERYIECPANKAQPLPDLLQDISRYMLVEYLGDIVIDVGLRHMDEDAKDSVIQDYKKYDPKYNPQTEGKKGHYAPHMKRVILDNGSFGWEELDVFIPRKIYK